MTGLVALLITVAVALAVGWSLRARDGRIRQARGSQERSVTNRLPEPLHARLLAEAGDGAELTATVTLLQLSTTFCAPCRHTKVVLSDYAGRTEGVRHLDVDLTDHPEWSTPLGVHTTPTTLVLDRAGRELFRIGGVPRRDALTEALAPHLG